jgi:nucleotide-binding universal stress UspA family protein
MSGHGELLIVGLDGRDHDADAVALARSLHDAFGGEVVHVHMVSPAAEELSRVAAERGAGMLVLGSTHRGTVGRIVPGGVASHLLAHAPCAIAVAPVGYAQSPPEPISRIGIAYDAMSESDVALSAAAAAAARLGASLHLYYAIHAISPDPGWDKFRRHMHEFAQEILDRGLIQLPAGLEADGRVLEGDAATALAEAASEDQIGLMFAGSRCYGPLREALLGGVGGGLLRTARCPLVLIPRRSRPAPPDPTPADGLLESDRAIGRVAHPR